MNRIRLQHSIRPRKFQARSLVLSYGTDLFAAQRIHQCQVPQTPTFLRLQMICTTAEFGQKLMLGLLETDGLAIGENSGIAVSIDPETGSVEDLRNDSGVIGYLPAVPMGPNVEVGLALEAWFYGSVVIPRLWVGEESILHPALLFDSGPRLTAIAGGELTDGVLPHFDPTELQLQSLDAPMPMHG